MPRPSYPDLRELLIDAYRGVGGQAGEYIYTISGFVQQAGYTDYFDYNKDIYDPALRRGVNRLDDTTIHKLEELYRNKSSMIVITINYDKEDKMKEVGLAEYRFISDGMVAAMLDIETERLLNRQS